MGKKLEDGVSLSAASARGLERAAPGVLPRSTPPASGSDHRTPETADRQGAERGDRESSTTAPPDETEALRSRHRSLVDKMFSSRLTSDEELEKTRIERRLDQLEAEHYRPVKRRLRRAIQRLRHAARSER